MASLGLASSEWIVQGQPSDPLDILMLLYLIHHMEELLLVNLPRKLKKIHNQTPKQIKNKYKFPLHQDK